MKTLFLVLALFLLSWEAWASSCPPDPDQRGEWLELELVSVTVDGAPLEELEPYSHHSVRLVSEVHPYDVDGLTRYCDFEADRRTVLGKPYFERYPVEADLDEIW